MAFATVSNKLQRGKLLKLLAFLVSATTVAVPPATAPAGYGFVPEKDADNLAKFEPTFFSIDKNVKDPSGNVKVVALAPAVEAQKAIDAASASAPAGTTQEKPKFELQPGIALPAINRGGNKADVYPFDQMEVGISFFVAATTDRPNPAKSLASTVSSATKRYKGQTPERKFTVRARNQAEHGEVGARIWRVQ